MKNPFLQDRNIFSKVQKSAPNTKKEQGQNTMERKTQYQQKYNPKPETKLPISTPSPYTTTQPPNPYTSYQPRQPISNYATTQLTLTNKKNLSSQKITFGDPLSSQAYHGDRTSGYFNMKSSEQQINTKGVNSMESNSYGKYDNLNYQPRKNNFFQGKSKNLMGKESFTADLNMKQTRKDFGKAYGGGYGNVNGNRREEETKGLEYEFAPPPINNFGSTLPQDNNKYQYQPPSNNYEYTPPSSYTTPYSQPYHQQSQQQFPRQQPTSTLPLNQYTNPYKSPPKDTQLPFTPKHDISARFKENNYAEFSPIGEVSRHKINEDSIMNLDGLMEGVELDRLLAESKTQEELLKILGMDASVVKRKIDHRDSGNKNNEYGQKFTQQRGDFEEEKYSYGNQNQNQFTKKSYQPEPMVERSEEPSYQHFQAEEDQPQVFNYGESYMRPPPQQPRPSSNNNQSKRTSSSPQKFNKKPQQDLYEQDSRDNFFADTQISRQRPNKNISMDQKEDQNDLQKIMEREMEKFMYQQQGLGKDRRVFMTANEKILTKKYKLQPL